MLLSKSPGNDTDRIAWYENDGTGTFTAREIAGDARGAFRCACGGPGRRRRPRRALGVAGRRHDQVVRESGRGQLSLPGRRSGPGPNRPPPFSRRTWTATATSDVLSASYGDKHDRVVQEPRYTIDGAHRSPGTRHGPWWGAPDSSFLGQHCRDRVPEERQSSATRPRRPRRTAARSRVAWPSRQPARA